MSRLALALLLLVACSTPATNRHDNEAPSDAGPDAGLVDAGTADAGLDAGTCPDGTVWSRSFAACCTPIHSMDDACQTYNEAHSRVPFCGPQGTYDDGCNPDTPLVCGCARYRHNDAAPHDPDVDASVACNLDAGQCCIFDEGPGLCCWEDPSWPDVACP